MSKARIGVFSSILKTLYNRVVFPTLKKYHLIYQMLKTIDLFWLASICSKLEKGKGVKILLDQKP